MISRNITVGDISLVTGFSRHKLKGLFRELPGYNEPAEQARIARHYSRQDLALLAICCELDDRYGLKRVVIGQLVGEIRNALARPRVVAVNAHLVIDVPASTARYVEKPEIVSEGMLIPLRDILKRIDAHLAMDPFYEQGHQASLNLGPVSVRSKPNKSVKPIQISSVQATSHRKKAVGGKP